MRTLAVSLMWAVIFPCGSDSADNLDGDDDTDSPQPFSGECGSNRGLDLLWDLAHSDFSDFREPPSIEAGWVTYTEPNWPLLGFFYPADWTAQRLGDPSSFGVLLTSPDGLSSMSLLYVTQPRADLTSDEIVRTELSRLGAAGQAALCRDRADIIDVVGSDVVFEAREAGGDIVVVQSQVLYDTGQLGNAPGTALNAAIYTFEGPETAFTSHTERVFIPVIWQLLIGDSDNQDTDGDGIYDRNDAFPNDPNRF